MNETALKETTVSETALEETTVNDTAVNEIVDSSSRVLRSVQALRNSTNKV